MIHETLKSLKIILTALSTWTECGIWKENLALWLQPCENPNDFRAEQCAVFDDVPYSGQLLKWYPHYDPSRPCALICRGEQSLENTGSRLRQEMSVEKTLPRDATDALQFDSEETIVVQLADKVEDGTKCYADSMDVCISGECMVSRKSFFIFHLKITGVKW